VSLRDRRVQYETAGLDLADLAATPIQQWHRWYDDAVEAGVAEPNAMTVSSNDAEGQPDARVVLAREVNDEGIVFYTNYESAKGIQLASAPFASAVFAWLDLHRQVRVRGEIEVVSSEESDAYFASRPRESQIGAWASAQSQVIAGREELEAAVVEMTQRFMGGDVPRPPHWGGLRIVPSTMEFWQGRPSRLHDRFRYAWAGTQWSISRLAPSTEGSRRGMSRKSGHTAPRTLLSPLKGESGERQSINEGLRMWVELGAFPVPKEGAGSANAWGKFELNAPSRGKIHWVQGVLPAEFFRNLFEFGANFVRRKMAAQMPTNMCGEFSIGATQQQCCPQAHATITMHRNHNVDVVEESTQRIGMFTYHFVRGNVPLHACRLVHSVIRSTTFFGSSLRNHFGHFFKATTVVRHKTKSAAQREHFFNAFLSKQLVKHECHCDLLCETL
jgi:pyridoxamine 5'-phosphate oxidase